MLEVLSKIKYKNWIFYLGDDNGRMYLQIHFLEQNIENGIEELQKSRKWMLSPYMCETEVVRTAHKAIRTAVEHEADENFTYKGVRVYSPHLDVNVLVNGYEIQTR